MIEFMGFWVFFVLTLENFSISRFAIPFAIFFGAILLGFFKKLPRRIIIIYLIQFFIICILGVAGHYDFFSFKSNIDNYTAIDFVFGFLMKLTVALLFLVIIKFDVDILISILKKVLIVHATLLFIQFFVVYSTGFYIDVLSWNTGEFQRYTSGIVVPIIGEIYRPTGFFSEPSTYSSYILLIVFVRYLFVPKLERIDFISILSSILTLSLSGLFIGMAFLSICLLNKKNAIRIFILFALLVTFIFVFNDLVVARLAQSDGESIAIRIELFQVLLRQSWKDILFGNGPLGIPAELASISSGVDEYSWVKNGLAAPNDIGLWFFFILKFGILGLITIISLSLLTMPKTREKLLFIIILMTKIKYSSALFVFVIFIMSIRKCLKRNN